MNLNEMNSPAFKSRLAVVYGNEADAQLARYRALAERFAAEFGAGDLRFFSAPGRTEVGGNHTDHNNGKVLAAAIDLDAVAVVAARSDGVIRVCSEGYEPLEIDTADLNPQQNELGTSAALIRGVCARFRELGYAVGGFNAAVTSRVLSGSGLSSSAAYEVLICTILNGLYNGGAVDAVTVAQASQYAENVFFGKPCGLMDQTACSVGGFVAIDFASTENPQIQKVDFDLSACGHKLCIIDTGGNHADLTDDYAAIRSEMNAVAAFFGKRVLRELPEEQLFARLDDVRKQTGDRAVERALHFYNENRRVVRLTAALNSGDFEEFKKIIVESGRSSFMYNQNCFTAVHPTEQPVALALCLTEEWLRGKAGYRVHGGGFAGTIQVFLPDELVDDYTAKMRAVFGENSCYILSVRAHGGCEI